MKTVEGTEDDIQSDGSWKVLICDGDGRGVDEGGAGDRDEIIACKEENSDGFCMMRCSCFNSVAVDDAR